MEFLKAPKDLIGDATLHKRFQIIKRDTIVASSRVSLENYFVAFVQDGKEYCYTNVPHQHWLMLVNRLLPSIGLKPDLRLDAVIKSANIKEFRDFKVAKLESYSTKKSSLNPHFMGTVRLKDQTRREAIILGKCKEESLGKLYILGNKELLFVPDAKFVR